MFLLCSIDLASNPAANGNSEEQNTFRSNDDNTSNGGGNGNSMFGNRTSYLFVFTHEQSYIFALQLALDYSL
jgi:hypothetical protein